ncbi:hypothetical protein HYH03_013060 [Edaphochlamys debaryana]|uniref:UBA domain-containing protein n=1 Tax=Edaphochlamys debaryana TaxID=47281 RepID=A0A835XQR6_9CHLO|nr:hypothetical protein HYH03_013060 [Edaphochlamys debaryana]|eukprot:KAG2488371.1 hypothetical protein HYH03_013060 [Edaphochlamys debaryana]
MAFAAALAEKRGPRVGDAASLWNFTPAPGWSRDEVQILRLCLMKHGVGQWMAILGTGLLPGKLIQQLNGQTQRLLGQQSLKAYTGLKVDVDRIRIDNETRVDATRKAGLIIYDGPQLTKEEKAAQREEAQRKYGLTPEQVADVDEQLAELMAALTASAGTSGGGTAPAADAAAPGATAAGAAPAPAAVAPPALGPAAAATPFDLELDAGCRWDPALGSLLGVPLESLSPDQTIQLLQRLRNRLACLVDHYRNRLGLPPRSLPRWEGEPGAAALLAVMAATGAAAAAAAAAASAMGDAAPPPPVAAAPANAASAPTIVSLPFSRELLVEATAGRMRSATAAPARPPGGATGVQAGGVKKQRAKAKPRASSGAAPDSDEGDGEWEDDEENAGPTGARGRAGARRKAGGSAGGTVEAEGTRRGTRGKRAAPRWDELDDEDEGGALLDPTAAIQQLTAMGFTPRKARGALRECDFNVEAAVEWLFANCVT